MSVDITGTAVKISAPQILCGDGSKDETLLEVTFWGHPAGSDSPHIYD